MNSDDHVDTLSRYRIRLLGLCAAFAFVTLLFNTSPLLVSALMQGQEFTEATAGAVLTGEGLLLGLSAILTAVIAPSFNPYRAIISGCVALLILHGISVIVDHVEALIAVRIFAGVAAGICLAGVNLIVAQSDEPVRLYGLISAGSTVVGLVALYSFPSVIEPYAHSGAFAGMAAFGILLVPFAFKSGRVGAPETPTGADYFSVPRAVFGEYLCTLAIVQISQAAFFAMLAVFVLENGFDLDETGKLLAATYVTSLLGALLAAFVGERHGRFLPLFVGLALHALAVAIVLCVPSVQTIWIGACLQTLGFFFSIAYQLGMASRLDPSGTLSEWAIGVFFISLGLGPYFGGALVAEFGFNVIVWFVVTSVAVGLIMFSRLDARVGNNVYAAKKL